ncbi:NAD-dependent deacetylase [Paenibacillus mucilaginosus]|uniref:SIR2 family NAD-dependent protein deacylase n=1 Tax=Paenibacillus mucilaginosus TaxID=61624 RepID=UPI003D1FBB6C
MLDQAAEMIASAGSLVVLTGAGCSVDAGVPDFRSPSGWWRKIDPRTVATVEALEGNYELFHEFYAARVNHLKGIRPHAGHEVLREWEEHGRLSLIATQNVDRLHQAAGNREVRELHGTIREFRCHDCRREAAEEAFVGREACGHCGGRLRPDVVLFGEKLPEEAWDESLAAIKAADAVLVIGTSLQVYPANQLPYMTKGRLILIGAQRTGQEDRFHAFIQGRAAEVLPELHGRVSRRI